MSSDERKNAILKQILKEFDRKGRSRQQKKQQLTTLRSSSIPRLPQLSKKQQSVATGGGGGGGGGPVDLSFPKHAGFPYNVRDDPNPPTRFSPGMDGPTHYQTGGAQKGRRPLNILSQTMGFLPPLPPAPRGAKRFSFSQSSMGAVPVDLSFPQQAGFQYDIRDHPNPPTRFSPTLKGVRHFQTGGAKGGRKQIKITAQKQKDQTENPPPPPKAKSKGNKKFFPDL
jgi:hypothetical protein